MLATKVTDHEMHSEIGLIIFHFLYVIGTRDSYSTSSLAFSNIMHSASKSTSRPTSVYAAAFSLPCGIDFFVFTLKSVDKRVAILMFAIYVHQRRPPSRLINLVRRFGLVCHNPHCFVWQGFSSLLGTENRQPLQWLGHVWTTAESRFDSRKW